MNRKVPGILSRRIINETVVEGTLPVYDSLHIIWPEESLSDAPLSSDLWNLSLAMKSFRIEKYETEIADVIYIDRPLRLTISATGLFILEYA